MFTAVNGYGTARLVGHISDISTWEKQRALLKTRVSVTRRREEEEGDFTFYGKDFVGKSVKEHHGPGGVEPRRRVAVMLPLAGCIT